MTSGEPVSVPPKAGQARMHGSASDRRRAIFAGVVGNTLEWYDFGVYGFLATVLSKQFFPTSDQYVGLLQTFGAFGVGFIARPLGGVILGRLGDVLGRKSVLLITIAMMAVGTLAIGLVPGYATIGIAAPIVLLVARLLQGFAAGGEWGNAAAFLSEWASPGRRGLYGGMLLASVAGGLLLGSGIAALLSSTLSPESMGDWGWRIPFLIGAALIPLGVYMRRNVEEPPVYRSTEVAAGPKGTFPVALARATCVCLPLLVSSYMATVYMPVYAQLYGGIARPLALWANSAALLLTVLYAPFVGHFSDRFGRHRSMLITAALMIVLPYPIYMLIVAGQPFVWFLALQLFLTFLIVSYTGSAPAFVTELFTTPLRSSGASLANAIAGVLGGFTPFISTWLIHNTDSVTSPSALIIVAGVAGLLALVGTRETAHEALA